MGGNPSNNIVFVYSFLDNPKGGIGQYELQISSRLKQTIEVKSSVVPIQPVPIPKVFHKKILFWDVASFVTNNPMWVSSPRHSFSTIHFSHQFMGVAVPFLKLRSALLRQKTKIIITVHDLYDLETYRNPLLTEFRPNWKWADRFSNYLMLKGISLSDRIIVDSNATRDTVIRILPKVREKVSVVYLGWNGPGTRTKNEATGKRKPNQLLYIGSLHPRKNIVTLANAVALLKNQGINVHLVVAGASRTSSIPASILDNPNVELLGEVTSFQISELYQTSSIFVLPSLSEGFGLPLVEAMGFGCPIIASDIPVFREIAGDAIVYVSPKDIIGWAAAIKNLLQHENLRTAMAEQGKILSEKFNWETTFRETLAIYLEGHGRDLATT